MTGSAENSAPTPAESTAASTPANQQRSEPQHTDHGSQQDKPQPRVISFDLKSVQKTVIVIAILGALIAIAKWAYDSSSTFLFLLFLSWLLAISMEIPVAWLARKGLRRGLATGIVLLTIFIVSSASMALFGGVFFSQIAELVQSLPALVTNIIDWINQTFNQDLNANNIMKELSITPERITDLATSFAGGIFGVLGSVVSVIFNTLTVLVFSFYLSADAPRIRRYIAGWLPKRQQEVFVNVWKIATDKTGGFVVSKVILATLSAVAHTAFYYFLDVPYWLPMGVFSGVTAQFIPTIGTYIGIVVPALFVVFHNPLDVIWIVAFATIYQQIENYVFTPKVSRRTMDIHPAVALGSVFVGVGMFGALGAIIGIPVAAAIVALLDTYTNRNELISELQQAQPGEKKDAVEEEQQPDKTSGAKKSRGLFKVHSKKNQPEDTSPNSPENPSD